MKGVRALILKALQARDGEACGICRQAMNGQVTIHHVVPKSRKGPNHPANFVLAHYSCNQALGNAMPPIDVAARILSEVSRESAQAAWARLGVTSVGKRTARRLGMPTHRVHCPHCKVPYKCRASVLHVDGDGTCLPRYHECKEASWAQVTNDHPPVWEGIGFTIRRQAPENE